MNFWESDWNADHAKYIRKVAGLGYDILEFQAQPLLEFRDNHLKDLKKLADDCGIELTYSLGLDPQYDVSSTDENVRRRGVEYLKRIMARVALMDGRIISGVSYAGWGAPQQYMKDKAPLLESSKKSMRSLMQTAGDYGITYCVEAVNRFEGCLLNTAEEAVAYVKDIGSQQIGVLLDTYHMNIEECSIPEAIRCAAPVLKGFHTGENNRTPPGCGFGHLDWDAIFGTLREVGYTGRIVSEPFVKSGGTVGFAIKTWRDLVPDTRETALDALAAQLLVFERQKLAG